MTSRELMDWLRTRSADEETEQLPDHAGTKTGRHVVAILQKRRVDAGDEGWRHRTMTIGHDPFKPVAS